jgi:hypothetical protein
MAHNFGGTFGGKKNEPSFDRGDSHRSDFDRSHNQDLSAAMNGGNKKKLLPLGFAVPTGYPPLKSSMSDIVDEKDREHLYN